MAAFATVEDVAARVGATYDEAESAQVAVLLEDASALIRARRPLVDAWITAGSLSEAVVKAVTCQVVSRLVTTAATGGVGLRSEQHPEYSYELTSSAAAGLNLTKAELALLTPSVGRLRPFSIQPS